ncbi:MAG TPA: hypothetical protein VGG97_28870 [Bryobacteraceae bacterium]
MTTQSGRAIFQAALDNAAEVGDTFGGEFGAAEDRFARWKPLLQRFTEAVDYAVTFGRGHFRAVDEAHNELCIASEILANPNRRFVRLDRRPWQGRPFRRNLLAKPNKSQRHNSGPS